MSAGLMQRHGRSFAIAVLCRLQDGTPEHAIRIAGNNGSRVWDFWVDVGAGTPLRLEVVVTFWQRSTAALDKLVAERMPTWATMLSGVSLHSHWEF